MAENFNPFDSLIFHRVLIEGQKDRISQTVLKNLSNLFASLKKAIKNRRNDSILELQNEINSIIEENYQLLESDFTNEARELLLYEAEYQGQWLDRTVESVPEDSLIPEASAIAGLILLSGSRRITRPEITNTLSNGRVRGATLNEQILSQKAQIKEMIRRSLVTNLNENADDNVIIEDITKVFNKNRAGTEALLKTVINAQTNDIALKTYEANGIKSYKYVAIMDSRTTEVCRNLNGQVFKNNQGPLPPQHYGCRSFIIPVIIRNGEVTEFKQFSKRKGDARIDTDNKGNFKKNSNFDFSLNKMKKEDDI